MKVICISGKAQNGKDTTAGIMKDVLTANGSRVLITHFGDLIKYICRTFFNWDGQKDERGRTLLQYVGTEKMRNEVSPDYWVDFVASVLSAFRDEWDYVLIPDCRYPNEYEVLQHYGFETRLFRVERPNFQSPLTPEQQQHNSETAMDNYTFDVTIRNDRPLYLLRKDIIEMIRDDPWYHDKKES